MGNAARKPKPDVYDPYAPKGRESFKVPVQDLRYWTSQNCKTESQHGLFSTMTIEEIDLVKDLRKEVKELKTERDNWMNKANELQEELRRRDRYIQGANATLNGNSFDFEQFMDALTASRIARHRKIEELDRSKKY